MRKNYLIITIIEPEKVYLGFDFRIRLFTYVGKIQ